jgi:outer membrane protein assembly factor BamB
MSTGSMVAFIGKTQFLLMSARSVGSFACRSGFISRGLVPAFSSFAGGTVTVPQPPGSEQSHSRIPKSILSNQLHATAWRILFMLSLVRHVISIRDRRPVADLEVASFVAIAVLYLLAAPASAGDWPQILGPDRTGVSQQEQLAEQWSPAGPKVIWTKSVGEGTAGVAVRGESVLLYHRLGDEEVIESLNALSGAPQWRRSYETEFRSQVGGDHGPLCVPTISGEAVITFGPQGVLCCWRLTDGNRIWRRNTHQEFDAREGYFGAGSSPLVDDGRVIVNVGGMRESSGIVAFDVNTGRELWTATDQRASYSAPTVASISGRQSIVCLARLMCVGLDPQSGDVQFEIPFGLRGATVNAATPLVFDNQLFLTASYGIGAASVEISAEAASERWRKQNLLSSQYTTPVYHDGVLYGIDGRDDLPPAHLRCVDPQRGKLLWSEDNFGYATLVSADDKLIVVKTDGELVLARPSRDRFMPLSTFRLTDGTIRALPALADGRLFVRDESTLYCLDVGRR